jgi:hypothetical protein
MEIGHADGGAATTERQQLWHRIEPAYSWDDLVLPKGKLALLRSIPAALRRHEWASSGWPVLDGPDEDARAVRPGLRVLFAGAPGTGRMLSARILGAELGQALLYVQLADLLIDDREVADQLLTGLFAEAESSNAILFLDEGDAWLDQDSGPPGKDERPTSIDAARLLERADRYPGLVIFVTGTRVVDEAPDERFEFVVDFPFPKTAARWKIWSLLLPDDARVSETDLDHLATTFKLSGAAIRDCCLAAAATAKQEGVPIEMFHVSRAVEQQPRSRLRGERMREALEHLRATTGFKAVEPDRSAVDVGEEAAVEPGDASVLTGDLTGNGESAIEPRDSSVSTTSGERAAEPAGRSVAAGSRQAAVSRRPAASRPAPGRASRRFAVLALSGTVAAAVLGFVVAQGGSGGNSSSPPRVTHVAPARIGPSASYASGLDAVISRLNATRSTAGAQLLAAHDAQGQAKAAAELAAAHTEAASALLRLSAGPASATNAAVAAALRVTANAYGALGSAAAQNDANGYRAASASLTSATNALNSAFGQLRALGYRVG